MKQLSYTFLTIFITLIMGCSNDSDKTDTEIIEEEPIGMYFPPLEGITWETVTSSQLDWNTENEDALNAYLEETNTKGFIVLKNG